MSSTDKICPTRKGEGIVKELPISSDIEHRAFVYANDNFETIEYLRVSGCLTDISKIKAAYIAGATEADKRAVEFAEWCEANYFQKAKGVWVADIDSGGEHYNTQYLLTIFNSREV